MFINLPGTGISNSKGVNRSCTKEILGFSIWHVGRWGGVSPPSIVVNYISHMTFLSPWHIPSFASVMIVTSPPGISCACLKDEAICLGKKIPVFFLRCPNFLASLVEILCEVFTLINKFILQIRLFPHVPALLDTLVSMCVFTCERSVFDIVFS